MTLEQRKIKFTKSDLHPIQAEDLQSQIFSIRSDADFNAIALELFRFQAENNPVYRGFLTGLGVDATAISDYRNIPALPISFFKTHTVQTGSFEPEVTFESSGTTGQQTSKHLVRSKSLYETSFLDAFQQFYRAPADYCVLALLPSYLERQSSSLVYMADRLIRDSKHPDSGFFLHDLDQVADTLKRLEAQGQKTLLLGVTFALLDLAEHHPQALKHTVVMETGGMKGRRKELLRTEVHDILKQAFELDVVHSEYGMTELLSQAYSDGNETFRCPPWMKVLTRDTTDPLTMLPTGRSGGLNIIDLANIHSCAFIATQDLGRLLPDGSFEILGRFDHSDVRGCNLMAL